MAKAPADPGFEENLKQIKPGESKLAEDIVINSIKKREFELKTELLITRRKAENKIASARAEAASINTESNKSNENETEIAKKDLERAEKQAAEIAKAAEKGKTELIARGKDNFDEALRFVLNTVLPLPRDGA